MKTLASKLRRHASQVLDPGYPYYGTPEMVREAADEIERLRLTDAEREAIRFAAVFYEQGGRADDADTLRGLLERTK
jgi:hypothetical protein